jgi:hypothetical protein
MDPGFLKQLDEPVALVVALERSRQSLHRSHPFPRQGSKSRSMLLNVPGRMSPACLGTTV